MDIDTYRALRQQARALTRGAADAEDLVQQTLLAALQAGRSDAPWLAGVMQRQAAMVVRGAARRRRREQAAAASQDAAETAGSETRAPPAWLRQLPPATRRVALLALHGLDAGEIRWILSITPTAFRQRLSTIRRRLGALPPALQREAQALAEVRDPARALSLQFGLLRRALKAALRGEAGLATHDADGHPLVIRGRAHTSPPGGNG